MTSVLAVILALSLPVYLKRKAPREVNILQSNKSYSHQHYGEVVFAAKENTTINGDIDVSQMSKVMGVRKNPEKCVLTPNRDYRPGYCDAGNAKAAAGRKVADTQRDLGKKGAPNCGAFAAGEYEPGLVSLEGAMAVRGFLLLSI